jgi:hypothetical protein
MTDLRETGLLPSKTSDTSRIFERQYSDILTRQMSTPSTFLQKAWGEYMRGTSALNGSVFETLVSCLLFRNQITPIFVQTQITFIPNIVFDLVLYTKECGPIILSVKTSLRERYKQADLEGMMLRQVHRKALSYLITANEKEAISVNNKIKDGSVLGIDQVVYAFRKDMDILIDSLTNFEYKIPPKVDVLTAKRVVTNSQ